MVAIMDKDTDIPDRDPNEINSKPVNVPARSGVDRTVENEIVQKEYYFSGQLLHKQLLNAVLARLQYTVFEKCADEISAQGINLEEKLTQEQVDFLSGIMSREGMELVNTPSEHYWLLDALANQGANILQSPGMYMIQSASLDPETPFRGDVIFGLQALETIAETLNRAVPDIDTGKPLCFDLPAQEEIARDFLKAVNAWAISGLGDPDLYVDDIDLEIAQATLASNQAKDTQSDQYVPTVLDNRIDQLIDFPVIYGATLLMQPESQKVVEGLNGLSAAFLTDVQREATNKELFPKVEEADVTKTANNGETVSAHNAMTGKLTIYEEGKPRFSYTPENKSNNPQVKQPDR